MMSSIAGIDKPVSRIVLGTMIINTQRKQESFSLLDAAYECGINTFDTAAVYAGGNSERCLGMWCAERGLRDKIVILDKGCHHNADRNRVTPFDLAADLHDALARLQTDHIDLYMLHRDDTSVPVGSMVEAMNGHLLAGRIKACGVSNWTLDRIKESVRYAEEHGLTPFAANSPNYGLAEQVESPWGSGCVSLSGPQHKSDRDWHVKTQMPVFAYSSLGRGLFSGRITRDNYMDTADSACQRAYCHEVNFQRLDRANEMARQKGVSVTQIALAFVLNSPMFTFALVGAANREEIEQCVAAGGIILSEEELAWLETGNVEQAAEGDAVTRAP
jgi:aryl-alcohol dehydrogenase-like predicted oxidoreductase